MPNYDLRCTSCEREYNIRATISEKVNKQIPCPNCGLFDLETLFKSPPAFVKGINTAKCPQSKSCGSRCPHAG